MDDCIAELKGYLYSGERPQGGTPERGGGGRCTLALALQGLAHAPNRSGCTGPSGPTWVLYYMRQITILTPFCSIKLHLECGEKLSSSGYIANKMVIMMLLGCS
jgi:hypothetical protein